MFRYSITIVLSAFLLFQVQPMIAKIILPWFGGTAVVWTTCVMFFQVALLSGYGYAHGLRSLVSPRRAFLIHGILLLTAPFFCSVIPAESLAPKGDENPTWAIVGVLAVTVGFPFFLLSSTSPLIQSCQALTQPDRSPYRLYALSNIGSLLALLSYPFLIEPNFSVSMQAFLWKYGFLLFILSAILSGWQTFGYLKWDQREPVGSARKQAALSSEQCLTHSTLFFLSLVWVGLTATASVVLLATTNLMCQEIASAPFLWVIPLTLYLLSFIISFDFPTVYRRPVFGLLLASAAAVAIVVIHLSIFAGALLQVGSLSLVCFAATIVCHGELERTKPAPGYLTWFYLMVSLGGALGGIFVSVVCPSLFNGFHEFHLGLIVALFVSLFALYFHSREAKKDRSPKLGVWGGYLVLMIALSLTICSLYFRFDPSLQPEQIFVARNEYGLVSVTEKNGIRRFIHGQIEHGSQAIDPAVQNFSTYYTPGSGVGIAFSSMRDYKLGKAASSVEAAESDASSEQGLQVGVLGLGIGGMMNWGLPQDSIDFYEINPAVEFVARTFFSYLPTPPGSSGETGTPQVILGDGRLSLQRRLQQSIDPLSNEDRISKTKPEKYDLLFIDAFSSDAIPVHLLTEECFSIYRENLADDGILIAHITNRFVDLRSLVHDQAAKIDLIPILIENVPQDNGQKTRWVLMTRNKTILNSATIKKAQTGWPSDMKPVRWTDDHASLFDVVEWSGAIDLKSLQREVDKEKK